MAPPRRILYALGPGDAVHAYREWREGRDVSSETSVTFSGQFFDYCRGSGTEAIVLSAHPRREVVRDGLFLVENRPKRWANGRGAVYHASQLHYAASILWTALRHRAQAVIVDSGTTDWFLLAPLCVSPECERQVRMVARRPRGGVFQYRAQFRRSSFASIPPPPPHAVRPFRVLFVGRVESSKGVFDLLEMAERLNASLPGLFEWHVCGDGGAAVELARRVRASGLDRTVLLLGKLDRRALAREYGWAHVVLVPTRSDFCEGLPMVSAEAVLAGRPVVSSSVNPAIDVLGDAFVAAQPDDVDSYVAAIRRLAEDGADYARRVAACTAVQQPFVDSENGLCAALARAIASLD